MSNISEHSDDIDWEKDPDWESEIVKGPKLAECIKDLFRNHYPDEVAKALGYYFIDTDTSRTALTHLLYKAIEECDPTYQPSCLGKHLFDIYKDQLCLRDEDNLWKVFIPKRIFEENPSRYKITANDWHYDDYSFKECDLAWLKETGYIDDDASDAEAEEVLKMKSFSEPMMVGFICAVWILDKDFNFIETLEGEDLADYYGIPHNDCHKFPDGTTFQNPSCCYFE